MRDLPVRADGRLFSIRSSRSPSPVSGGGGKEEGSEVFPASQLTPSASFPLPGLPDAFRIATLSPRSSRVCGPGVSPKRARYQFGRKLSSESQTDFSLSLERGRVLRTESRLTCLEVCLETPRLHARIYVPCQLRIPTRVRPGSVCFVGAAPTL